MLALFKVVYSECLFKFKGSTADSDNLVVKSSLAFCRSSIWDLRATIESLISVKKSSLLNSTFSIVVVVIDLGESLGAASSTTGASSNTSSSIESSKSKLIFLIFFFGAQLGPSKVLEIISLFSLPQFPIILPLF